MVTVEVCENCGEKIGKLETPHLWNERVVCGECKAKLASRSRELHAEILPDLPIRPPVASEIMTLPYANPVNTPAVPSARDAERELYAVRSSIWHLIVAGVVLIWVVGIGLLYFLAAWHFWTCRCVVTSRRVVIRRGILSQTAIEIPLAKVASIEIKKGIFGFGRMIIGGHGLSNAFMPQLADPERLRDEINRAVEAYAPH